MIEVFTGASVPPALVRKMDKLCERWQAFPMEGEDALLLCGDEQRRKAPRHENP